MSKGNKYNTIMMQGWERGEENEGMKRRGGREGEKRVDPVLRASRRVRQARGKRTEKGTG